jgi:restriction system protein
VLPKQKDIEIPLLDVLMELGGKGRTSEIVDLLVRKFPKMRDEDLAETLPSGGNKWNNRVRWVRQTLIFKGEISSPAHGVWAITDKGKERLKKRRPSKLPSDFTELYEDYEEFFRSQLLSRISELTPRQFELLARKLLEVYGFVEVKVKGTTADGGIDGYGKLKLGLAAMNVAFQCKRWQGNVGRPEVDKFRGAIQGEFEQGVFFATSDFSAQARDASLKKGAVPIILVNGDGIVDLMIQKEVGLKRVPVYMYYERPTDFAEEE